MSQEAALERIQRAVDVVVPGKGAAITLSTDLVGENVLDSLDLMNFLFELEQDLGARIPGISDEYEDYRVSALVELLQEC